MKRYAIKPIVYEYRFANVSEPTRQEIMDKRFSLFERSRRIYKDIPSEKSTSSLFIILGIVMGIIAAITAIAFIF